MQRVTLPFPSRPFLKRIPEINPIMPKENICQGAQGLCPKKKFETKAVMAPTKNPVYPPKQIPEIITIATTGLNSGSIKNAVLPTTPIAHKTLIITSSLACGFRDSKTITKGIIVSRIISKLIK